MVLARVFRGLKSLIDEAEKGPDAEPSDGRSWLILVVCGIAVAVVFVGLTTGLALSIDALLHLDRSVVSEADGYL